MESQLAKLLERGGPSMIPLGATMFFANLYLDARPEIPLYTIFTAAMAILTIVAGFLFVIKWAFDWPDTSEWTGKGGSN